MFFKTLNKNCTQVLTVSSVTLVVTNMYSIQIDKHTKEMIPYLQICKMGSIHFYIVIV